MGEKKRGRRGEGSIYWDEQRGKYRGEISLGYTPAGKRRRKVVFGDTQGEVQQELRKARDEHERGVQSSGSYTVADMVTDWLTRGLKGRSTRTVELYTWFAGKHVIPALGALQARDLLADHIEDALEDRQGVFADRSMKMFLMIVRRSAALAIRRKKITENVALYVERPEGREGRPSKAMPVEVARWALEHSKGWLHAYLATCLTTGVRTEEARPLEWSSLDLTGNDAREIPPHAQVWRSVRKHGETKTRRSRRSVALSAYAVGELKVWKVEQEAKRRRRAERLGITYKPARHVFGTRDDQTKDAKQVRRALRNLFIGAKLPPEWTPRETRTTFVSILSDEGEAMENIAQLLGHSRTATTEEVYRKQLRPVIRRGSETVGRLFGEPSTGL